MPLTTAHRGGRRTATGLLGTLGVLAALCAYLLGAAPPAAAHAVLTGSSPAAGAVVSGTPEEVTLTFSERVLLSDDSLRVLGPDGKRADTGKIRDRTSNDTVRYGTPLRDDLPDGTYTVAWRAVSADSHPISGAFTFSIGAPSETSVALPGQEAGGGLAGFLYDTARYAAYAGFVLLVGGVAFVLACWPPGARVRAVQRLVTGGWIGLTAATLAMLLLRTPYTGSGELADAFDLAALGDVAATKTGTALVSRLLLLAAAALFTAVLFGTYAREAPADGHGEGDDGAGGDGARRRDLVVGLALGGAVIATGLAVTWAASEHASTGIQTAVAMPVDVVHLLAVAAWLGGLGTLAAALFSGTGDIPRAAVRRFSRIAFGSVAVLAATGVYQSWRQVGSWSALTGTDYGRLLLLKVALITVLIAIGALSRRWTSRLTDPPRSTTGVPAPGAAAASPGGPTTAPSSAPPAAEAPAGYGARPHDAVGATHAATVSRAPSATQTTEATTVAPATPPTPVEDDRAAAPPGQAPADQSPAAEASGNRSAPRQAAPPRGESCPPEHHTVVAQQEGGASPGPGQARPAGDAADTAVPPAGPAHGSDAGRAPERDGPTQPGLRAPGPSTGPPAGGRPEAEDEDEDPERAAQLARQRSAVAATRRRRQRDADPQRAGLRRTVLAETCVAVAVLAVTTLLTGTQPARNAEAAEAEAGGSSTGPSATAPGTPRELTVRYDTGGPQGRGTAEVTLDPGRTGRNTLDVRLTGPAGKPLDVPEVKAAFTLPAKDIGPLRVTPREAGPGRWRAGDLRLPVAGEWELALTVRTSDIDQVTETRTVRIR